MKCSSLKKYVTLHEVVEHINKKHRRVKSMNGANIWKMLKLSNGERIPFEQQTGVRITDLTVLDNNTIAIEQQILGYTHKKQNTESLSRIYLFDLIMVNIYDFSAEFLTNPGIVLFYSEKSVDAKIIMMSEWIHDEPDIIRAQWFRDDEVEKLLDFSDKKIQRTVDIPRSIDFEGDF